jgi:hypothetical protein
MHPEEDDSPTFRRTMQDSISDNTQKLYRGYLSQYEVLFEQPYPITSKKLSVFCMMLIETGKKVETVKTALSAIKTMAVIQGKPVPVDYEETYSRLVKTASRKCSRCTVSQAAVLSEDEVYTVAAWRDAIPGSLLHRAQVHLVLSTALQLRSGELKKVSPENIKVIDEPVLIAHLVLERTKTRVDEAHATECIQGKSGAQDCQKPGFPMCPAHTLKKAMLRELPDGFMPGLPFHIDRVNEAFLKLQEALDIESKITGHTGRRTGTHQLLRNNVEIEEVRLGGQWADQRLVSRYGNNDMMSRVQKHASVILKRGD